MQYIITYNVHVYILYTCIHFNIVVHERHCLFCMSAHTACMVCLMLTDGKTSETVQLRGPMVAAYLRNRCLGWCLSCTQAYRK